MFNSDHWQDVQHWPKFLLSVRWLNLPPNMIYHTPLMVKLISFRRFHAPGSHDQWFCYRLGKITHEYMIWVDMGCFCNMGCGFVSKICMCQGKVLMTMTMDHGSLRFQDVQTTPICFFLGAKFATNPLKNGNSLTTFIQSKIRFHGHWPHILGGPSVVCLFGMLEKCYSWNRNRMFFPREP